MATASSRGEVLMRRLKERLGSPPGKAFLVGLGAAAIPIAWPRCDNHICLSDLVFGFLFWGFAIFLGLVLIGRMLAHFNNWVVDGWNRLIAIAAAAFGGMLVVVVTLLVLGR